MATVTPTPIVGKCEYLLTPGGRLCPLPAVVTVRVDPAVYFTREPLVVGNFCEEHAARMRHHVVHEPLTEETEHA